MSSIHRGIAASALGTVLAGVLIAVPGASSASAADAHAHGHVAAGYTLELLAPTNGGVSATALGINDLGDVVGTTRPTSSSQPQRTVLWERHGDHFHAHELANLEGSQFSRGFDINDDRTIVGEAFNASGNSIPIRWQGDAAPTHVTTLNEAGTGLLNDIADDGVAVGAASAKAVRVAPEGTVSVLAAPAHVLGGVVNSYTATSVADGDVIAGRTSIAVPHGDHSHNELFGVIWENGVPRLLENPDGGSSPSVAEVTPDGEAVGSATVDGKEVAVHWSEDGVRLLQAPEVADYPHFAAKAAADDVVVGYASKFAGNTSFGGAAVAWDAHGPVDLNTRVTGGLPEGVQLLSATDINESGQVVGAAATADGARGYVLTPVPEPTDPEPTDPEPTDPEPTDPEPTDPEPIDSTPVRATSTLQVKLGSKRVVRGKNVVVKVRVRAGSVTPTGRVQVRVAGKKGSAALVNGRATVRVKVPRTTPLGARKLVVKYLGSASVSPQKKVRTIRVVRP